MIAVDKEPLLTVKQAAKYLNVHFNTVYRRVGEPGFPGCKVGKIWRFKMADLDRYASRVVGSDALRSHEVDNAQASEVQAGNP
jgi:excisionase family DNA binding protein